MAYPRFVTRAAVKKFRAARARARAAAASMLRAMRRLADKAVTAAETAKDAAVNVAETAKEAAVNAAEAAKEAAVNAAEAAKEAARGARCSRVQVVIEASVAVGALVGAGAGVVVAGVSLAGHRRKTREEEERLLARAAAEEAEKDRLIKVHEEVGSLMVKGEQSKVKVKEEEKGKKEA